MFISPWNYSANLTGKPQRRVLPLLALEAKVLDIPMSCQEENSSV
jgi:hypothetical protein